LEECGFLPPRGTKRVMIKTRSKNGKRQYPLVSVRRSERAPIPHTNFLKVGYVSLSVFPTTRCRLKLLKYERIKDYLLMEEEFVQNQELFKPREDKNKVKFCLVLGRAKLSGYNAWNPNNNWHFGGNHR
jgi:hypothetical protein